MINRNITTSEEIVDILDNSKNILYQTSKSKAHVKGLLHATVIGEVINSYGQLLLIKQSSSRQDANQLVSPVGGHVKAGESFEDAIKREALEELSFHHPVIKHKGDLIFRRLINGKDENHYFVVFELFTDEKPILNHESKSYQWFTDDELKKELNQFPEKFGGALFPVIEKLYPQFVTK